MKKISLFVVIMAVTGSDLSAQKESASTHHRKRLDFAKMYFELGGSYVPSFMGIGVIDNELTSFENPASITQYLNWGGFHFWGHAEFYVTIPLNQYNFEKRDQTNYKLSHSVATGFRLLPWAYREKSIRPYLGFSWSALEFQQKVSPNQDQPILSKDFMLVPDAGFLFGHHGFSLRLGINYFYDNSWNYPISRTDLAIIETPKFNLQFGLNYSFETSRSKNEASNDRWNNYPEISKPGLGAARSGSFFVGAGPSLSFSLSRSRYNQKVLPYLPNQLSSGNYFDVAVGYQFNRKGLFAALSFRNPEFETEAYGTVQTIKKSSFALEVSKFLTDYSGFAPFIGINVAYDRFRYLENVDNASNELIFKGFEPGVSFGWDIIPGKADEAIILRTNLRWYPFSTFAVDGLEFNFSQLEYNLIQVVFYPERLF